FRREALLEVLQAFAQSFAHVGQLARAKNEKSDQKNQKELSAADSSHEILRSCGRPAGSARPWSNTVSGGQQQAAGLAGSVSLPMPGTTQVSTPPFLGQNREPMSRRAARSMLSLLG